MHFHSFRQEDISRNSAFKRCTIRPSERRTVKMVRVKSTKYPARFAHDKARKDADYHLLLGKDPGRSGVPRKDMS